MLHTLSPPSTEALGALTARFLIGGDVVTLRGDLGSGKTTFVRGLARGLGFEGRVGSPTYALCATYELAAGRQLHHFDAYLAEKERAFLLEGGAELMGGDGIAVLEWPERIEELLPADRLEIEFAEGALLDERILGIRGTGPRSERLAREILAAALPAVAMPAVAMPAVAMPAVAMPTFGGARSLGSPEVAIA